MLAGLLCIGLSQPLTASGDLKIQPVIGTTLSWDAYGVYPLDGDEPLTPSGRHIVDDIERSERGRAENLARYRLSLDKRDLVPAWALARIVRAKGTALEEYERNVKPFVDQEASVPQLLYRYAVCNFAMDGYARTRWPDYKTYSRLDQSIRNLRERCRPAAARRLGVAVTLIRVAALWDMTHRDILEEYRRANPQGVDVRPLLCRAYLGGMVMSWVQSGNTKRRISEKEAMAAPDAPKPSKALEIANSILRERPSDPLGLYYRARSDWALGKQSLALRDMRSALGTNKLPALLRQAATSFLSSPSDAAFDVPLPMG